MSFDVPALLLCLLAVVLCYRYMRWHVRYFTVDVYNEGPPIQLELATASSLLISGVPHKGVKYTFPAAICMGIQWEPREDGGMQISAQFQTCAPSVTFVAGPSA